MQDDIQLDKENLDDSVVEEEYSADKLKKLKEKLKEAESKAKEYLDGWQRAQAEFVNIRKRDEEGKQDFMKFASADLMMQLMPALDALSLAVSHGEKGVEQIQNLFLKVLKQNGLEEVNPLGEAFDPRQHEAIGVVETKEKSEDHKVLEVMQKGYILSGKIIRPAKVRIGEFKE